MPSRIAGFSVGILLAARLVQWFSLVRLAALPAAGRSVTGSCGLDMAADVHVLTCALVWGPEALSCSGLVDF